MSVVVVGALGLSACAGGQEADHASAASGPRPRMVASGNVLDEKLPAAVATTKLVDQDGRTLTLRSLRGKIVVLAPMLALCQETCPMTSANLHAAAADARRMGPAGRVVYLEVTVDPDRDTVKRLHAYEKLYGALPNWELATGRPAAIKSFWKKIGVSTDKVPSEEKVRDWMTGKILTHNYDIHHQDLAMVMSPAGHIRWITIGRPDAHGGTLPTTVKRFLNDEGRRNYHHPGASGTSTWTTKDVEQAVRWVNHQDQ